MDGKTEPYWKQCIMHLLLNLVAGTGKMICVSAEEENNVSDMQLGTWTKLGTGQPHCPISDTPSLNGDVKDPNNTSSANKQRDKLVCPTVFRKKGLI